MAALALLALLALLRKIFGKVSFSGKFNHEAHEEHEDETWLFVNFVLLSVKVYSGCANFLCAFKTGVSILHSPSSILSWLRLCRAVSSLVQTVPLPLAKTHSSARRTQHVPTTLQPFNPSTRTSPILPRKRHKSWNNPCYKPRKFSALRLSRAATFPKR